MKKQFTQSSRYLESTAYENIRKDQPVQCVTAFVEVQYEYVDKHRTDNIKGYKLWFIQEGLNPFSIKFQKKPELPPFLSIVEFENLQGIEIRSNVYFKADGMRVVK